MAVRAVRGAIQLDVDEREHLLESVQELVRGGAAAERLRRRRPDQRAVHRDPRPAQRVPGAGRARARPGRRAADVHPGAGHRRRHAARRPADGPRRDRPARAPTSSTSTCAARWRCAATWPSEPACHGRRAGLPERSASRRHAVLSGTGCSALARLAPAPGVVVELADPSPTAVALARDLGAGRCGRDVDRGADLGRGRRPAGRRRRRRRRRARGLAGGRRHRRRQRQGRGR